MYKNTDYATITVFSCQVKWLCSDNTDIIMLLTVWGWQNKERCVTIHLCKRREEIRMARKNQRICQFVNKANFLKENWRSSCVSIQSYLNQSFFCGKTVNSSTFPTKVRILTSLDVFYHSLNSSNFTNKSPIVETEVRHSNM